jgi:hypothetical protein
VSEECCGRHNELFGKAMRPWITAALLGLILALAGPRVLEVIRSGSDPWGVMDAAVSSSLWALLPSLVIGWFWHRVGRSESRYLPALISILSTLVLLVLVVQFVHHRWLGDVGFLLIVPAVVCGIPLAYLMIASMKSTK